MYIYLAAFGVFPRPPWKELLVSCKPQTALAQAQQEHLMLCKHRSAFFLHFCSTPLKIEKLEGVYYRPSRFQTPDFSIFSGAAIHIH